MTLVTFLTTANMVNVSTNQIWICPKALSEVILLPTTVLPTLQNYEYLKFDPYVDINTCKLITDIIIEYWDSFAKEGTKRPILGYEFGIDTGGDKPVCCRKTLYGPYESKIILTQVAQLLTNKWIEPCGGPWLSMIVLV